ERRLAPVRGGGGLAVPERDARPGVGTQALPVLRADEPRRSRPAALGLPLAGDAPDARAAHRDGRGLEEARALVVVRLGQVLDALDGRVLRVSLLERDEELARELLRHVDARDDDARNVAFFDLVVDAGGGQRELVVRERDVREVRLNPGEVTTVHV